MPQVIYSLAKVKVWVCGSMKAVGRAPIPKDIMLGDAVDRTKVPRGTCSFRHDSMGTMMICQFMDKRAVIVGYSTPQIGTDLHTVVRKVKEPGAAMHTITISRPDIVAHYNQFMRGVDVGCVHGVDVCGVHVVDVVMMMDSCDW